MLMRITGGRAASRALHHVSKRMNTLMRDRRGVILLAVLVFVALLLPLVTLVLTSINTESVSTAETIKGAKAEMAAEKAINDAVSLVVQEKAYPSYYTSVAQSGDATIIGQPQFLAAGGAFDKAIIVRDPITGERRNQLEDSTGAMTGAGQDDMWGTGDDYWTGPRHDRSYIPGDYDAASSLYRYDFRFNEMHGPTYIGQSWSFSTANRDFAYSQFNDAPVWLFNQFAAIDPRESTVVAGVPSGYNINDPFDGTDNAALNGPGYYTGATDPVNRDLSDNGIENYMYSAKVNLYESIYSDLDRGPIPTSLLKSYANVSDEAGRLNLNIFCKKVRVYMPEAVETDYDFDGYSTNDFNMNTVTDEDGWKWMDNPLFPDRYNTRSYDFDFSSASSSAALLNAINDEAIDGNPIDFGIYDPTAATPFVENTGAPDAPLAELGETVQHTYTGDVDGDGVPDSIESMRTSLRMLTSIPGIDPRTAAALLTYLNPPHDIPGSAGALDGDPNRDYNPVLDWWYPTLDQQYNNLSTFPTVEPQNGMQRLDACNITPPLICQDITMTGGVLDERRWALDRTEDDDLPLPQPHPLSNLEDLLNIPGMSQAKFERLKDYVTIFSYDTNLIANYIQDVGENADLEQAYTPGDPEYTGSVIRSFTADDTDDLVDMRFNVDEFVYSASQRDAQAQAERMFAFTKAHLPRPLFDKIHLPVVDRLGRADEIDSYRQNDDAAYDLSQGGLLLPHRDSGEHPYNVGASGHQFDIGGGALAGAGYPALNPEFTLDSCLAIVTYRNGQQTQLGDDYSSNPQGGNYSTIARLPFGPLLGFVRRLNGPIAFFLDTLQDTMIVDPNAGFNVNPIGRPHGSGVMTLASLLNPGEFDSVADTLNVPLYGFRDLAVDLLCDPPSGYRADVRQPAANTVQAFDPIEQSPVNYYATMSDVWDVGDYVALAGDDGQLGTADDSPESIGADGVPGTPDDPELYRLYFTIANRPDTANPGAINPDLWQAEVPITSSQLRGINAGVDEGKTKISVVAYDNINNINVLGPQMLSSATWQAVYGPASSYSGYGNLFYNFSWQDCPYPEDQPAGVNVGDDANGRPDENIYWEGGIRPAFDDAYAFDIFGDPFLTARVEVVKQWGDSDPAVANPENQLRADDSTRLYIQNNLDSVVPFRVDILPVRVAGDSYELRSAVGGETTTNGTYLLYDWELNGDRTAADQQSFDGTWPEHLIGQNYDPRIIRVAPQSGVVSLRVYDLRAFEDGTLNLPIQSGYPELSSMLPAPYTGGEVNLDPLNTSGSGWPGLPAPVNGDAGYWEDVAAVQSIITSPEILPEITLTTPSIYANDTQLEFRASAVGGSLPYNMTLRISNDVNTLVTTSNLDEGIVWPGGGGGTAADWLAYNNFNPMLPAPTLGFAGQAGSQLGATIAASRMATSNDVEETFAVALGAPLAAGTYWVELEVTDGTVTEWAYTALSVGTENSPGGSTGRAPEMATSINLLPLDSSAGESRLGFVASASTDGGQGGYNYYWEVTRPIYDADGVVTGYSIVDSQAPFVSIEAVEFDAGSGGMRFKPGYAGRPLVSNEANPSFEFHPGDFFQAGSATPGAGDGVPDAYGIYFVHCYVFDQASSSPNLSDALVAHDVAMVRINDTGSLDIGDSSFNSAFARTPMAVLHALPPGNATAPTDPTTISASGPGSITLSQIDPPHAAIGDVIAIYGTGFNLGSAQANTVRFGGSATTTALRVENLGGGNGILYAKVPAGARTGYLAVSTGGSTSAGMFFMTNFQVTFDLIGNLAPNSANYLQFDLDYQGDGHIDYTYSTMANPQHPGLIKGAEQNLTYDYARDGVGNYMATLYVKDLISGRVQKDQQLIMIRDPEQFNDVTLTLTSGVADETRSDGILIDYERDFDPTWATYAVEVVQNPGAGEVIGAVTGYDAGSGGLITSLANWNNGDAYEIRRTIQVEGTGDMIVNIWPEIDQRFDTFTPDREEYAGDPDAGLSFYSATGGGFFSSSSYTYKWMIDDNSKRSTSVLYTGEITAPDPVELDPTSVRYAGYNGRHAVVIDSAAHFVSGGVKAGDIFFNGTDNDSYATILQVVSNTELLLTAPGLGGGAAPRRQRSGTIDQILAGQVINSGGVWTSDWDWRVEDTGYNFFGLHTGGTQGGLVGDPAGVGAGTANGDGSDYFTPDTAVNDQRLKQWLNETEHTRWEIVSTPQAGATDQLTVSRLPAPDHADNQGLPADVVAVRGTQDGVRAFALVNGGAVALGGLPPRFNLRTNQVWPNYDGVYDPGLGVGAYVYCNDSGSLWRIVDVPVALGGTLTLAPTPNRWIQVEYVSGGTPVWYDGPVAAQRQNWIILPSQWVTGDTWSALIAKRQLRVGDLYRIIRDNDNTGVGSVNVTAQADADYASLNATIDFNIALTYPFDLATGSTTTIEINWNSTDYAGADPPRPVDSTTTGDGGTTSFEEEALHVSHQFGLAGLTNAWFWINYTDGSGAHRIGPYALPQVLIGGDDFDTWPNWNGATLRVNSWDPSQSHRVSCEVSFDVAAGGTFGANRRFAATDQLYVPAGMNNSKEALTTYVSYSRPFVTSNAVAVSRMTQQGVHGGNGASLNWIADANADTIWNSLSESPLSANPVNYFEFVFGTPSNQMNVSGLAYPGNGACFPRAVPGVGRAGTTGGFTYYIADRGVYTGMGFTSEALADLDERGFTFDSQPIFVGERISGNSDQISRIGLAADIYITPLASTNSQQVALLSYVTGGNGNPDAYTYQWTVVRYAGGTAYTWTSNQHNPLFYPLEADTSGDGSGSYRAFLTVTAPSGVARTGFVEFEVITPAPLVNVMANPPSTTTGASVEFQVYQEGYNYDTPGGVQVRIDYGKTTPAFSGTEGVDWAQSSVFESGLVMFDTSFLQADDYTITVDMPGGAAVDATTQVAVADRIPLKASLLASPPSGVAPFATWIDYSVSGGEPFSHDTYQVTLQLINTTTGDTEQVSQDQANTFGSNGVKDSLSSGIYDDEPVYFVIPESGSYVMFIYVLDNSGNMYSTYTSIYAGGYTAPVEYGKTGPIVVADKEGRPMHAMRIWTDPFLSRGGTSATEYYGNTENDMRGGRLLEADLQVLGDVLQTDPNPNWRSFGNYGVADPYSQPRYFADYSLSAEQPEDVQDYYDTFTEGRVNINTASVETMTALFRNIIRLRGYDFYGKDSNVPTVDEDGDGINDILYMRDPTEDVYLTQAEARALAEAVVDYRNAYYDLYKPDVTGHSDEFGYLKADGDGTYGLDNFRVDHLPVIGPYDGVNPYDKNVGSDRLTDRVRALPDADDTNLNNAYDHMAAGYYNFGGGQYMFYSPSDVAYVRPPARFAFDINGDGVPDTDYINEPASNYAKYMNDVMNNTPWEDNRYDSAGFELWADTGLTPGPDYYSRWSFDARNYFYHGTTPTVMLTLNLGTGAVAVDAAHSTVDSVSAGRNKLAIVESNGETAYAYLDNPPFRSLFDLYKVINASQAPDTFGLSGTGSDLFLNLYDGSGTTVEGTTVLNQDEIWRNAQVFSGPSMFRYACHWYEEAGEFIPVANYLDDLAPFVTCRSYVFRVEAVGAVTASGGNAGAVLDTARISRDRSKEAIVDVGPLWTRTGASALSDTEAYNGLRARGRQNDFNILYYRDNAQ
jgi:hypothetical protein